MPSLWLPLKHTHTQTPVAAQIQVSFPFHPSAQTSDLELGHVGRLHLLPFSCDPCNIHISGTQRDKFSVITIYLMRLKLSSVRYEAIVHQPLHRVQPDSKAQLSRYGGKEETWA